MSNTRCLATVGSRQNRNQIWQGHWHSAGQAEGVFLRPAASILAVTSFKAVYFAEFRPDQTAPCDPAGGWSGLVCNEKQSAAKRSSETRPNKVANTSSAKTPSVFVSAENQPAILRTTRSPTYELQPRQGCRVSCRPAGGACSLLCMILSRRCHRCRRPGLLLRLQRLRRNCLRYP